jgi:hypothetical protein
MSACVTPVTDGATWSIDAFGWWYGRTRPTRSSLSEASLGAAGFCFCFLVLVIGFSSETPPSETVSRIGQLEFSFLFETDCMAHSDWH